MRTIPPAVSDDTGPRRSQRVILKASVLVLARDADNKPLSEETHTVTVNAHGAMILLSLKVSIGEVLMLRHLRTGEEVSCRVVYVNPHQSGRREIGIDFIKPFPRFWRISFPPDDWTTRSPEAKGSTSRSRSPETDSKKKK